MRSSYVCLLIIIIGLPTLVGCSVDPQDLPPTPSQRGVFTGASSTEEQVTIRVKAVEILNLPFDPPRHDESEMSFYVFVSDGNEVQGKHDPLMRSFVSVRTDDIINEVNSTGVSFYPRQANDTVYVWFLGVDVDDLLHEIRLPRQAIAPQIETGADYMMGAFADEIGEGFADRMMGANPLGFVSNRVVENIPGMTLDEWAVMDLIGQQMIALDSSERWNQGEYTVETDDGNLRLTYEIRVDNGSSATSSSNSGFGNIQNGGFTGRINATYLNVRNGPGPEYEQIDRFDFGHNITIIGRNEEGTWVEITNPDGGWISVAYASVDGSISQLPVTYQETGEWGQAGQPTGVVARITFTARLRGGPGTNYRQLDNPDTLPVGEQVDIIGRSGNNNWYKVNVDNRSAWISHLAADIIGNNNIPIMDR